MSQQNIQELITSAQHHHEEYIRGLRILRDSLPVTRDRADSRSSAVVATSPPLRAQTFASDSVNLNSLRGRPRRDTLEAPERPRFAPSPQPSRVTISNHDGEYLPVNDDDFSFIPLLDPASPRATFHDVGPRATKRITPMSFSDEMLLSFLKDEDFPHEMALVLEEAMRRRQDIDMAMRFRDFASYERESYVSSTFEIYEVLDNTIATKISTDVDVSGSTKYGGDGPFESPDGIVDAPIVWDAIREINQSTDAVGRIT